MDYQLRLALSYYEVITTINAEHEIYMVQHRETHKIYIKKTMSIYNLSVYQQLKANPINGIPRIYEIFEVNDNLCIIEEFISGNTLEELLNNNISISNDIILDYMRKLCTVVSRLHAQTPSIIHRDIKPSNIIVNESGNLFLIDLNAAKFMDVNQREDTQLIGTKGYAAPEQYGFGSSSTKTDIYAMGILLNTLITGDNLIKVDRTNIFYPIILKATKLDPSERYSTALEMLQAIEQLFIVQNRPQIAPMLSSEQSSYPNANMQPQFPKTESSQTSIPRLPSFCRWLPPGFRTLNPVHMIVSIFIYVVLIKACYSVEPSEKTILAQSHPTLYQTGIAIIMLIIVFFSNNYGNIHRFFPMIRNAKKQNRFWAIVAIDFILLFFLIGLWGIILR